MVPGDPCIPAEQALANTRVAAAAPELLATLSALVERMERTGRDTANTLDLELTKKARAAIAKAEGRS